MANYTIRPINTGFIPANLKLYHYHHSVTKYYPEIEAGMQMTPCFAFLLENNGEYCLVDTGMSSTERANKYHHPGSQQDPGMAIHEQLAALGIACEQIKTVILTHMHWDHVYNLEKFKHARIVANETELAFAKNPIPLYYKSYEHPFLGIQAPFTGLDIETCSGEQEILPGVRVFETPGHSPGHMSVEVETKCGKYIIAGDSAFRLDNFKAIPEIGYTVTPPSRFADIVSCWKSLEIQKNRCENLDHILMTHEISLIERCKETPVIGL